MANRYEYKDGVGKHRDRGLGRFLAPGDVLVREPWEIAPFADKFEDLGPVTGPEEVMSEASGSEERPLYIVQHSPGWFDVMRLSDGLVLNDKALRRADADRFVNDYEVNRSDG